MKMYVLSKQMDAFPASHVGLLQGTPTLPPQETKTLHASELSLQARDDTTLRVEMTGPGGLPPLISRRQHHWVLNPKIGVENPQNGWWK